MVIVGSEGRAGVLCMLNLNRKEQHTYINDVLTGNDFKENQGSFKNQVKAVSFSSRCDSSTFAKGTQAQVG